MNATCIACIVRIAISTNASMKTVHRIRHALRLLARTIIFSSIFDDKFVGLGGDIATMLSSALI